MVIQLLWRWPCFAVVLHYGTVSDSFNSGLVCCKLTRMCGHTDLLVANTFRYRASSRSDIFLWNNWSPWYGWACFGCNFGFCEGVWHGRSWYTSFKTTNVIRRKALDWINSHLCNRTKCVRYNNISSDSRPMVCVVLQGSILGPLLFLFYG